jgi:F-type H+-transporting ATPase subunit b
MRIDWWTLGLQAINALILVWLLSRFLFRPIADILAKRQAAARRIVNEAEAAKAAADEEKTKAQAEVAKLAANRGDAMKAAKEEAEKRKAALIAQAREEADKIRAEADKDVARVRAAGRHEIAEKAGNLAVDIAARLLDRLPDDARIMGFIDGLADGVAALPDDVRNALAADGTPLQIAAARTMTDQEKTECRKALKKALSRDVDIDVSVDPDLIAGLELHGPHAEVRNSFRADLDRLRADLERHDENHT